MSLTATDLDTLPQNTRLFIVKHSLPNNKKRIRHTFIDETGLQWERYEWQETPRHEMFERILKGVYVPILKHMTREEVLDNSEIHWFFDDEMLSKAYILLDEESEMYEVYTEDNMNGSNFYYKIKVFLTRKEAEEYMEENQ